MEFTKIICRFSFEIFVTSIVVSKISTWIDTLAVISRTKLFENKSFIDLRRVCSYFDIKVYANNTIYKCPFNQVLIHNHSLIY